jgi:uncharacterized protein
MSGEFLLDANVLIALAWPAHQDHARVQRWFTGHSRDRWATCPFTQAAFVRIISNPAFSPDALTPADALALLQEITAHPSHRFWGTEIDLAGAVARLGGRLEGHRQVTDAYLLGLVIYKNGRLATMDQALITLLPEISSERHRVIIV